MNERDIIQYITGLTAAGGKGLLQGVGDDCAVIEKDADTVWLLTMDTLVENVHFDRSWHPAEKLGRKSISVNVSDIAGMGGIPLFILLSVGMPRSFDKTWFETFSLGIAGACRDYGCILIGGDTVCSPECYSFTVTVIGEADKKNVIYRSGAQPGDTIWVSGALGHAAAGLQLFAQGQGALDKEYKALFDAHLDPCARTQLGQQLGKSGVVHAMMDLSDGLATDLAHLCERSEVKGQVYAEKIPVSVLLRQAAARLGKPPESFALNGGEDYELLFTAPPKAEEMLVQIGRSCSLHLHPVGTITEGRGVTLLSTGSDSQLIEQQVAYGGFDHFSS